MEYCRWYWWYFTDSWLTCYHLILICKMLRCPISRWPWQPVTAEKPSVYPNSLKVKSQRCALYSIQGVRELPGLRPGFQTLSAPWICNSPGCSLNKHLLLPSMLLVSPNPSHPNYIVTGSEKPSMTWISSTVSYICFWPCFQAFIHLFVCIFHQKINSQRAGSLFV